MIIHVHIKKARAKKDNIICDVEFTSVGGPNDGEILKREFVYSYPTTIEEITLHLTDYANMLKVSFDAPDTLEGMEFDI